MIHILITLQEDGSRGEHREFHELLADQKFKAIDWAAKSLHKIHCQSDEFKFPDVNSLPFTQNVKMVMMDEDTNKRVELIFDAELEVWSAPEYLLPLFTIAQEIKDFL